MIRRLLKRPRITAHNAASRPPAEPGRTPSVVAESRVRQTVETGRTRLIVAGAVFAMAFAVVGLRVVELAVFQRAGEPHIAEAPKAERLETGRADIVDRNGIVLATTLPTASLYADATVVRDPGRVAAQLATALSDVNEKRIRRLLESDRRFVWIKRNITPREQYEVNLLGVPGLDFARESKRVYPQEKLTAHVVGYTDIDNRGLAGIERSFDEALRGSAEPLSLSLDLRIQHILVEELNRAMTEFSGIGAAGVVLDARTGEALALASLPSFDPSHAGQADKQAHFNRATLGVYEMGSVFKAFTAAMALDSGAVAITDSYDVSEPIRVARFTISDFKPKKKRLTVPEVLIHSSNIGTVQMVQELGTEAQQRYLGKLGLLEPLSIELPEVGTPRLPDIWREINTMTIAYGHGISVSPLQLTGAMAAVVNGGQRPELTLLKRGAGEGAPQRKVFDAATSDQMRWMLRQVVLHGTGRFADAEGYLVGGKTGTADKLRGRTYSEDARISSFLAAFPMDNPRYVVFAMVDEPKGLERTYGYATGGWVAAPAVARVVERAAPFLGIKRRESDLPQPVAGQLLVEAKAHGATTQ